MKTKIQIYKNSFLYIFLIGLFFIPIFSSASFLEGQCTSKGYTIVTVNGMNTIEDDAKDNLKALKTLFGLSYNNQEIEFQYFYNGTHVGGVVDFLDVIKQKSSEDIDIKDFDMREILNDASSKVKSQKLLLIGHSQGNFYANSFYNLVAGKTGGIPSRSIEIYGVASPASYVAGRTKKYITSSTDSVINLARLGGAINVLAANAKINKLPEGSNGHAFREVYLEHEGARIVKDIQATLNNLLENNIQNIKEPCMSPPKLDSLHKVTKAIYSVVDPTANETRVGLKYAYKGGVYVANSAYSIGSMIGDIFRNTGLAVNNIFNKLSANALESLPDASVLTTLPLSVAESEQNLIQKEIPEEIILPTEIVTTEEEPPPVVEIIPEVEVVENPQQTVPDSFSHGNNSGGSNGGGGSPNPDTTAPVITMTGANSLDITKDSIYTDAGATATDDIDDSVTVVSTGIVDTAIVGIYSITYSATDLAGNVATPVVRTVNVVLAPDTTAPVITITGNATEVIAKNSVYADAGATALDNVDGVRVVTVSGITEVNTAIVGVYTITYTATDLSNNSATAIRTVKVDNGARIDNPNFVAVSGNYAYIVSDNNNSFEIIDISNPATLVHKSSLVHDHSSVEMFKPKAVAVSGNYAYVVSFSNNLNVIDISNPVFPIIKSTLTNGSGGVEIVNPNYITISGNYAFIASYGNNVVEIIDISDPLHPFHKGKYYLGNLTSPYSVDISGNYMYIVFVVSMQAGGGMQVVDIFDPSHPVLKNTFWHTTGGASIYNPQSISVVGNYAYITSRGDSAFEIVDISNPLNPTHKGKIVNGTGGINLLVPKHAVIAGNYAYVSLFNGSALEILDITDPANPVHKGNLADGTGGAMLSYLSSISVVGNYAYVTSTVGKALEIVDISDPTNPFHKNKILNGEFNHTDPILNFEKQTTSFKFSSLDPEVVGVINDTNHTISLTVPFDTNITALTPTILISSRASVAPNTGVSQNFTNPVTYTVTAENGTTQNYNVTVTVSSDPNPPPSDPIPDTTSLITSYTFNGTAGNITVNPTVASPLSLVINTNENVDWVSIKIEKESDHTLYKIFQDSASCADGTQICTKSWNGLLSGGSSSSSGVYKIKLHLKDLTTGVDKFYDYLTPYNITVDTAI